MQSRFFIFLLFGNVTGTNVQGYLNWENMGFQTQDAKDTWLGQNEGNDMEFRASTSG